MDDLYKHEEPRGLWQRHACKQAMQEDMPRAVVEAD